MATLSSNTYASQSAIVASGLPQAQRRLEKIDAVYTLTGTEAANDFIAIAQVPAGCSIDLLKTAYNAEALGTSVIVDFGTSVATSSLITGIQLSAGNGGAIWSATSGSAVSGVLYDMSLPTSSVVYGFAVKTATTPTAGKKLKVSLVYAV